MTQGESGMPRCSAISSDSAGCVVPENSMSFFFVTISTSVRPLAPALASRLGVLALAVPADRPLLGAFHAERTRRDVLGDHRSCARDGSLAELHRCDEHRIRTHPRVVPDDGAMLAIPVVVHGDGPRPDVGSAPDPRVPDVGQMR